MNDVNDLMSRNNAGGEVIFAFYSSLQYSSKHIEIGTLYQNLEADDF